MMPEIGKYLLIAGCCLVVAGLFFTFAGKLPFVGKLPGDIMIKKENMSFYFPIATCIILSVLVNLILWLFRK